MLLLGTCAVFKICHSIVGNIGGSRIYCNTQEQRKSSPPVGSHKRGVQEKEESHQIWETRSHITAANIQQFFRWLIKTCGPICQRLSWGQRELKWVTDLDQWRATNHQWRIIGELHHSSIGAERRVFLNKNKKSLEMGLKWFKTEGSMGS